MTVTLPTNDQLRRVAERIGFDLADDELTCYRDVIARSMPAYQRLDEIPDYLPEVKYPRTPGYRPLADEDPYNAWLVKTDIKGASRGKLRGKRVVVKIQCASLAYR
jgi:amidase